MRTFLGVLLVLVSACTALYLPGDLLVVNSTCTQAINVSQSTTSFVLSNPSVANPPGWIPLNDLYYDIAIDLVLGTGGSAPSPVTLRSRQNLQMNLYHSVMINGTVVELLCQKMVYGTANATLTCKLYENATDTSCSLGLQGSLPTSVPVLQPARYYSACKTYCSVLGMDFGQFLYSDTAKNRTTNMVTRSGVCRCGTGPGETNSSVPICTTPGFNCMSVANVTMPAALGSVGLRAKNITESCIDQCTVGGFDVSDGLIDAEYQVREITTKGFLFESDEKKQRSFLCCSCDSRVSLCVTSRPVTDSTPIECTNDVEYSRFCVDSPAATVSSFLSMLF